MNENHEKKAATAFLLSASSVNAPWCGAIFEMVLKALTESLWKFINFYHDFLLRIDMFFNLSILYKGSFDLNFRKKMALFTPIQISVSLILSRGVIRADVKKGRGNKGWYGIRKTWNMVSIQI